VMIGAVGPAVLTVMAVVAACLILAWPVYRIVEAWLDRRLDTAELTVGLFVMFGFLAGIMTTWGRPANLALWLLLIALAFVLVAGTRQAERRRLDEFFEADVAAAKRAIVAHPDNAAAYMRLGQLFEQRGDLDTAIEQYEEVVRLMPRDAEGRLALANAVEKHRMAATGGLICWQCGRENARDAGHCAGCGALISDRNRILSWLSSRTVSLAVLWGAGILLPLALVTSLLHVVPAALTVLLYLLVFLLACGYVYPRWARSRG
jgi:tetratricopeptide (TPR) repeat protein